MDMKRTKMEIEIRAFIDDFSSIKEILSELGAKKVDETIIEDIWFCKDHIKSYEETKMNKVGSYGLRFRLQKDRKPQICIKTILNENDHQVFGEFETEFENPKEMEKIFQILGFKKFCVVNKKRETYSYENMKINLEDIRGFNPCIEIEIIDHGNFEENKKKMHKITDLLKIKEENRINTSITSLFMEKNSFK
jgi:predicted adenylyl cyclase CyaB